MAFDDELAIARSTILARTNRVYEQVRQLCLNPWMQMDFRLFKDNDRLRRNVEALDDNRQNLANAEADISQLDIRHMRPSLDEDLVLFAMFPELRDLEISNE